MAVYFALFRKFFNPLNDELNPICHLLALLGGATIVVVSRLRVNSGRVQAETCSQAPIKINVVVFHGFMIDCFEGRKKHKM